MKIPDGIKIHPENDKMYAKKCPECGNTMIGGFHEDEKEWAFGCPNRKCGNEGWWDIDGQKISSRKY